MIKKIAIYSFVFLVSLLVFLVLTVPANVVWEKLLSKQIPVQKYGVRVLGVDGSIWSGRVHAKYQHLDGIVSWDIQSLGLLGGALPISLKGESALGVLTADARLSMGGAELHIPSAELALSQLSPYLRRERVTLSGDAFLKDIRVSVEDGRITEASGKGSWSGGQISYPVGRNTTKSDMPAFYADLSTNASGLVELSIRDQDAAFDVIEGSLNEQGEAFLQVKRRLLDLAGQSARHKEETDVVFKVKKPLYQ